MACKMCGSNNLNIYNTLDTINVSIIPGKFNTKNKLVAQCLDCGYLDVNYKINTTNDFLSKLLAREKERMDGIDIKYASKKDLIKKYKYIALDRYGKIPPVSKYKFFNTPELINIRNELKDKEKFICYTYGSMNKTYSLIALTNKRIILSKVSKSNFNNIDISLKSIKAIQYKEGLFTGKINIILKDKESIITKIPNITVIPFGRALKALIEHNNKPKTKHVRDSNKSDIYSELEKLHSLQEKGIIDAKMYEEKKNKLLNKI